MKIHWMLSLLLLAFVAGGCSPSQVGAGDSVSATQASTPVVETPGHILPVVPAQGDNPQMSPVPTPYSPGLQSLVDAAKKDLSNRFSFPEAEISVAEVSEVIWPDSGLGCSQSDMASAQVLTPGYLILLEYNSNKYEYHADKNSYVTYCVNAIPLNFGLPTK
jgi:hypothetical protein